ncbi:MAG: permease prefix domain 1-containing protein [Pirellulaceae bacterium]|nr:permease prefix domain 1-containing protein [Pirellulaceae bacterium]
MSEREFEHYLTLLGSMLRLRPEQRAEIAEELQQHLDERLVDLQAAGLSRDEAIQQALAEFGDAAGLAAQFSSVSRRRYRRWMMRAATASVTSAFMVLMLFVSFWPAGGRIELASPTTAQDATPTGAEVPAGANNPFTNSAASTAARVTPVLTREAKNAATRQALEEKKSPQLNSESLAILMDFLSAELPHGCWLDRRSLEESGVSVDDSQLSWQLEGASIATMLEMVLVEFDLGYQIRDGILVITTADAAESKLSVVVYDAEHLFSSVVLVEGQFNVQLRAALQPLLQATAGLAGGDSTTIRESIDRVVEKLESNNALARFENAVALLQTQVDPDSWEASGGSGTISCLNQQLIVRQSESTHRKIQKFLEDLAIYAGK